MFLYENLSNLYYKKSMGYKYANTNSSPNFQTNFDFLANEISNCSLCNLSKTKKISQIGQGQKNSNLVFISEYPLVNSDPNFQILDEISFEILGFKLQDLYLTSLLKCLSQKFAKNENFSLCLPYIQQELAIIKPKFVVIFGENALFRLLNFKNFHEISGGFFKFNSHLVLATCDITQSKITKIKSDLAILKGKI